MIQINKESDTKTCRGSIISLIFKKKIIQRNELISLLTPQFGEATINRHIRKLIKSKEVKNIKYPACKRYGILLENRKHSYLVLRSESKKARYYNVVITALNSKNQTKRDVALAEIMTLKEVSLTPLQLTKLSKALSIEKEEVALKVMNIIDEHVSRGIIPKNKSKFKLSLLKGFDKHRKIKKEHNYSLRCNLLKYLGILDCEKVIKYLIEEIKKRKDLVRVQTDYGIPELALMIQENETKLFKLSLTLSKDRQDLLLRIRNSSKGHLNKNLNNILIQKKVFKE